MTLRMDHVMAGLPEVVARYRERLDGLERGLRTAERTLGAWAAGPEEGDRRITAAMAADNTSPYALSYGEPLTAVFDAPAFEPVTVVAADGSSIDPDRFAAVQCYVVSIGEVVLPYGVPGAARLEAKAWVGPHPDDPDPGEGGWAVTLRRDVQELEAAVQLGETAEGETVMLLDGTLLPWDLDAARIPPETRDAMLARTRAALGRLAGLSARVSPGAYVSASRAGNVTTSLRELAGRPPGPWPPSDAVLFARLLGEGQRSAVFLSATSRRESVESQIPGLKVCFFYLRVGGDIARVELPGWAADAAHLARLHATLVDQCRRCGGYPRALQEAHEQAVISGGDRLQFARQLEAEAARQGLMTAANGKQMSKRRRAV